MPLKGADPERLTFARLCCCCFVVPFVFVVVFNKVIKVNDGKSPARPPPAAAQTQQRCRKTAATPADFPFLFFFFPPDLILINKPGSQNKYLCNALSGGNTS